MSIVVPVACRARPVAKTTRHANVLGLGHFSEPSLFGCDIDADGVSEDQVEWRAVEPHYIQTNIDRRFTRIYYAPVLPTDASFLTSYLPYLLRQADQTLSAPFYAELNKCGVARSEWRVLTVLCELGELPVVDLAAAALSPQPTVTHALRRLEKRGLITRTPGENDKRQRFISLTPTGAELTAALITEAKQLEADALADAGDLSDLVEQLRGLTTNVEARLRNQPDESTRAG